MSRGNNRNINFESLFEGFLRKYIMYLDFLVLVTLVCYFNYLLSDQLYTYLLMRFFALSSDNIQ